MTAAPGEDRTAVSGGILISVTGTWGDAAQAARDAFERLLAEPAARPFAERLPPGYADRLQRFVALLLEANERLNLTRITDPEAIATLHLLDAVSGMTHLPDDGGIADLGSGGGVPALPLQLALPRTRWLLIEATRKKADALRRFATALDLGSVAVAAARAEELGRAAPHRGGYDAVTARACAPLPVLVEYALPLLRTGGQLVAWKGALARDDPELRAGARAASQLGGARPRVAESGLPALGGHTFVLVEKVTATPAGFPRRVGEPARRPLGV
jgi:16S rRNA (guanine527-N7)-methyltransferase